MRYLGITRTKNTIKEARLKWYGHVIRRLPTTPTRRY